MGRVNLDYSMKAVDERHKHLMLSLAEFQKFNTGALGIGELGEQTDRMDALAAIYDLEGFSSFCSQVDPQLVVPDFLERCFRWLFSEITARFAKEYTPEGVVLWGKFPFFVKFTGDGVLMLWDTRGLGPASMGNIVVNLCKTCQTYVREFLPSVRADFPGIPLKLRCGIARGEVIPIGGGKDFVGSCINVAARLQKISQLSFAFSRKGFDPVACFGSVWQEQFLAKRIVIRGVGKDELVLILKQEFDVLPDEEKELFREP